MNKSVFTFPSEKQQLHFSLAKDSIILPCPLNHALITKESEDLTNSRNRGMGNALQQIFHLHLPILIQGHEASLTNALF